MVADLHRTCERACIHVLFHDMSMVCEEPNCARALSGVRARKTWERRRRGSSAVAFSPGMWMRAGIGWTTSWQEETGAALAPPGHGVVLEGGGRPRGDGHLHRQARGAVAALGRAPRRTRPPPH